MKALIQRVDQASVSVDGECVGSIKKGLVIFLGVTHEDTSKEVQYLVNKVAGLRIFTNEQGKMDHSASDLHLSALVISQFTLYGQTQKGRRPDFTMAANPIIARKLYESFITQLNQFLPIVECGQFGAHMQIQMEHNGPVSLLIETPLLK